MTLQSDSRIADLTKAGKVRAGLFLPQYEEKNGQLRGVGPHIASMELIRALAARIGIAVEFLPYASPADVVEAIDLGQCDLGVMGRNASRNERLVFSATFLEFDFTYMVTARSSIQDFSAVDRPGIRISVAQNHAPSFAVARIIKHADLIEASTVDGAFAALQAGQTEVFASARPILLGYSEQYPGYRVFDERYGVNPTALGIAKWRLDWLAYLDEFIADARTSGLIKSALEQSKIRGVRATSAISEGQT